MEAVCLLINHFRDHLYLLWSLNILKDLRESDNLISGSCLPPNHLDFRDHLYPHWRNDKPQSWQKWWLCLISALADHAKAGCGEFITLLLLFPLSVAQSFGNCQVLTLAMKQMEIIMVEVKYDLYHEERIHMFMIRTAQLYALLLYNLIIASEEEDIGPPCNGYDILVCSHI